MVALSYERGTPVGPVQGVIKKETSSRFSSLTRAIFYLASYLPIYLNIFGQVMDLSKGAGDQTGRVHHPRETSFLLVPTILSHRMYELNGFRKSTAPQNRDLIVYNY